MSEFSSLLKQNISLYKYTTLHISICKLIETWVCSTFWLFWIMLPWTWVYKCLISSLPSFPFVTQPQVELLNHLVVLCLVFWGISILFSTAAVPFYTITSSGQGFQFLTNICYFIVDNSYPSEYTVVSYCGLYISTFTLFFPPFYFCFKSKSSKIFLSLHNKMF